MKTNGIEMPDKKLTKSLDEEESCKYQGVLRSDENTANEIKEKVKKKYKLSRKELETKLNSWNVFKAINASAHQLSHTLQFSRLWREEQQSC